MNTQYIGGDTEKLRFVLNGKLVENPQNREIRSTDRLLIDFSTSSDAQVLERFDQVAQTAAAQNHLPDPAACGGEENPK